MTSKEREDNARSAITLLEQTHRRFPDDLVGGVVDAARLVIEELLEEIKRLHAQLADMERRRR